jgi:hypothetical protein
MQERTGESKTGKVCTLELNIEARPGNHFCRGKSRKITYFELILAA